MLEKLLFVLAFLLASILAMPVQADEIRKDGRQSTETDFNQNNNDSLPTLHELPKTNVDGVQLAQIEANVVSYTNQERARFGLPPLRVDRQLMASAREHAAWMTERQALVHTSQPVAENIAMGQSDSGEAVQAWMNSSGHRANILNAGHRRIGVAAFRTVSGVIYWCQQFMP